jgi:large subunit ribosomal protein L25
MAASNDTTSLKVSPREAGHSRATRRLRRTGAIPGVVYGGTEDPVSFQVAERTLRHALQDSGAVMQLEVEGGSSGPVVVKELVREGGVLEHVVRELTIEALPGEIPETIAYDVSEMQIGDTLTIEQLKPPSGVTLLDDPETLVATLTPPKLQVEADDEIESETQVVGEGEASAEAAESGGDAGSSDDGDSE